MKPSLRRTRRSAGFSTLASSYRSTRPTETLAAARSLAGPLGISRVTDITRLDRLGLPVFASVRPRSLGLRVHAGKGVRPIDACVGAWMEAIEHAVAEPQRTLWERQVRTVAELTAQLGRGIGWIDLAPRLGIVVESGQRITAIACERMTSGEQVMLPAELIFYPFDEAGVRMFNTTTCGLASGNSVAEATLHAIFEVLEHDALAMNKAGDQSLWIDSDEFPQPYRGLAKKWADQGVDLALRFVPNAFDLPCFEAYLHEPAAEHVNLVRGSGLHANRNVALARSICEAAQARAVIIQGGRDDITRFYSKYSEWSKAQRSSAESRLRAEIFNRDRRIDFRNVPNALTRLRSLTGVLDQVLQRLASLGFEHVFRHVFVARLGALSVVKVVIPKCEDLDGVPPRMGPRLLRRLGLQ